MTTTVTPAILIHLVAAIAALVLGTAVLLARKGTFAHRMAGRGWGGLMLLTAISTWWIRSSGSFSWIHILSVIVLVMVPIAVYFAITGNIRGHKKVVQGLFVGGLVIAGAFSFLPQRLLGHMLWSSLGLV